MRKIIFIMAAVFCACLSTVRAEPLECYSVGRLIMNTVWPANRLDSGLEPGATAHLAKIKAKTYFIRTTDTGHPDCPSQNKVCQLPAYLVAGDEVVVGGETGNYVCAAFIPDTDEKPVTVGLVAKKDMVLDQDFHFSKEKINSWIDELDKTSTWSGYPIDLVRRRLFVHAENGKFLLNGSQNRGNEWGPGYQYNYFETDEFDIIPPTLNLNGCELSFWFGENLILIRRENQCSYQDLQFYLQVFIVVSIFGTKHSNMHLKAWWITVNRDR